MTEIEHSTGSEMGTDVADRVRRPFTTRVRPLPLVGRVDPSTLPGRLALVDRVDGIGTLAPAVVAVRWCIVSVSLAMIGETSIVDGRTTGAWVVALVGYAVARTFRPIRDLGDAGPVIEVCAEALFHTAIVVGTGSWESPFVFLLMPAIVVGGFARGLGFALAIGMVCAGVVTVSDVFRPGPFEQDPVLVVRWTMVLALVGIAAGFARRISGETDRRHSIALDRLDRLSDANALLFSLHRIAQTLPASLDLGEVLDSTVSRLRGLLDFDALAVFVFDDTDRSWEVVRRQSVSLPVRLGPTELPAPLMDALSTGTLVHRDNLASAAVTGVAANSGAGLYTVLSARGSVIGLLAVESRRTGGFERREIELLQGFVEPVGLAIDNARWFSRLRTVGADEERTRIARDLHDNMGQSLAYLAFELDRVSTRASAGDDVVEPLASLRHEVRQIIGEVRDTLYDLRTDVSDAQAIGPVIDAFAARVMERSEVEVEVRVAAEGRLPLLQEREMWRIAQEALLNVERHAGAARAVVSWECDGERARLEVSDDGIGFPGGSAGRADSYGIVGMRERAASVGATFEIDSSVGAGTVVRCELGSGPRDRKDPR